MSSKRKRYYRFTNSGFTLLELLVVSMLMIGTATIMARFWRSVRFGTNDLIASSSTAEEMRFVVENISKDFGSAVGATIFGDEHILICQDSGPTPNGIADWAPPDIMVEYFLSEEQLRRIDRSTGTEIIVGDNVSLFIAEEIPGSILRIIIELEHGDISRRATFLWSKP